VTYSPPRPLIIDGIEYASAAEAARAIGITRQAAHGRRARADAATADGRARGETGRPAGRKLGRPVVCGKCGVAGHSARNRKAHPVEKSG